LHYGSRYIGEEIWIVIEDMDSVYIHALGIHLYQRSLIRTNRPLPLRPTVVSWSDSFLKVTSSFWR